MDIKVTEMATDGDSALAEGAPIRFPPETLAISNYFSQKAVGMRVLGVGLIVLTCPLILLLVLMVRLTSPGPAFYRQRRLGRCNREFNLIKIRTMYHNAEAITGPRLCQPGDSRVTPIGRALRFLHLDELPQLINVMRGEMCLVGPRPERPEIIERNRLRTLVPGFDQRVAVLPGVTGLAQINLPSDVDASSVVPKVRLDLMYIETASVGLDLRILLCTALRMLGIRHGRAVRWLGLTRDPRATRRPPNTLNAPKLIERGSRPFALSPKLRHVTTSALSHMSDFVAEVQSDVTEVVDSCGLHEPNGDEWEMTSEHGAAISPMKPR